MKKMFVNLLLIAAAVMTMVILPMTASADSFSDAKDSVVYIEAQYSSGYGGSGTGFAIGKKNQPAEYIVTNAHVVSDLDTGEKASNVTVYYSYAANEYVHAQIVALDAGKDFCVLKLPEPTKKRKPLVICKSSDINMDDEFAALGFPGDSDTIVADTAKKWDTSDITVTRGSISRQTVTDDNRNVYQIDISISNGNSGGPLVNSKGEVVGINTFSMQYTLIGKNRDLNYALVIDDLVKMLDREEVPYTLSTDANISIGLIIGISAGVAVVIAVVVIVIVLGKKKRSPRAGSSSAYSPVAASSGAVITGMKGAMTNRSFNINGSIVMGRNAQKCNVCFPVDTKGVSSVHCRIQQVNGGYEIVDCGSSNGTFLGSGQRLTPNVPVFISDGTYFYLGSSEQLFQIKY